MSVIAITGADGFAGLRLCAALEERGHRILRVVRRSIGPGTERRVVADLSTPADLRGIVEGAEVVVHLAARAHVLRETAPDPLAVYRRVNVEGTERLAVAAASARVRRFVFLSSIGVNGGHTTGMPFRETDAPAPIEPYAVSKWEAERALHAVSRRSGLDVVIARPTLVYGPGVKGNFLRILRLAHSGVLLPLAAIQNRRSLIGIENLCELLALCIESPAAAGETFLAAEPEPHSTPDLVRALAHALGRPSRLFPMPESLLRAAARATGMGREFEKLCGSLEVCADKAAHLLGWTPRVTFEEGIARTAAWFKESRRAAA